MASKVLIKIPAVDFNQVGKHGADLVNSPAMCAPALSGTPTTATTSKHSNPSPTDPVLQIHQLEQNIRFLKEQHQVMLAALHLEVETLRNRNRDLQFQLVFSRGGVIVKNTPEDATKTKVILSQQVPATTVRVEVLEKDVADLRVSLSDARAQNAKLQSVIDEQQRKLSELSIKSVERSQPTEREISLANQLQETEKLVYRMRRVHDEQRRELSALKGNKYRSQVVEATAESGRHHNLQQQQDSQQHPQPQRSGNPNRHHNHHHLSHYKLQQQQQQQQQHQQQHEPPPYSRDFQSEAGNAQGNRFPPLPAQAYWQNNGQTRWTSGGESGQRQPAGRPSVQSMPSLPAITPGTHQAENPRRTHHYYRSGGSSREGGQDGPRRYRGRNAANNSGRSHRAHEE